MEGDGAGMISSRALSAPALQLHRFFTSAAARDFAVVPGRCASVLHPINYEAASAPFQLKSTLLPRAAEAWSSFLQQQLTPAGCSHLQREGWLEVDGALDTTTCQALRAEIQARSHPPCSTAAALETRQPGLGPCIHTRCMHLDGIQKPVQGP